MHGHITKFNDAIGFGVIRADDGSSYRFSGREIMNPNGKLVGHDVDFVVESRNPREIILMYGSPWTAFGSAR